MELKFSNGGRISINRIAAENEVAENMRKRSALDALIAAERKPLD